MFFPPLPRFRAYTKLTDYISILTDILTGRLHAGDDVARLESDFVSWSGARYALAMPQARIGIYFAVRAVVGENKKVIMSPYTIFDVVNMVVAAGGTPVFADIERETCNIDPTDIERLIDNDTAAVMITHLHGLCCDIDRIAEICRKKGIPLIEDAAQALGAKVNGKRAGTFGDIGIYSFGFAKNVNCFYGGMVVTNSVTLHEKMKAGLAEFPLIGAKRLIKRVAYGIAADLTTFPPLFRSLTYWMFRYGYLNDIEALNKRVRVEDNPVLRPELPEAYRVRLSAAQARLVRSRLSAINSDQQARIEASRRYHEGLQGLPELQLPPLRLDGSHGYLVFPIQTDNRHDLVRHLMKEGRDCTVQHLKNCAELSCFEPFARDCPNARWIAHRTVVLPTYPRYKTQEVDKMIQAVRSYFVAAEQ